MSKNNFDFLHSNTFNKIISLVIAIILWAYVIAEVNPVTQQTMVGIPVQLYNIESISERGLALSGGQAFTVDVVLEGKRRDMVQVSAGEIIATADLFGFGKGENTISVGVSIPDGLSIVEVRPSKIKVTVEELVTATRPVSISFSGTPAEGFEPGAITADLQEIDVTGAESAVKAVARIQAVVDMDDLDTDLKTIQVRAEPVDAEGVAVENVKVSSRNVKVTGRLLKLKEVLLKVEFQGQLDPLYEISYIDIADTIMVKGEASAIESLAVVSAEPIDISAVKMTRRVAVKPILPEGVEVADANRSIQAEIGVRALSSREFTYGPLDIEIRGLGSGLSGAVKTESIAVTVTGRQDVIESLESGDITLFIDLEGQTEGVGNHPVYPESTAEVDGIIPSPTSVYVIISRTE